MDRALSQGDFLKRPRENKRLHLGLGVYVPLPLRSLWLAVARRGFSTLVLFSCKWVGGVGLWNRGRFVAGNVDEAEN